MKPINFEFALKDGVRILPIGVSGIIDSLLFDSAGAQYRVAYWFNGERKTTWVYADELLEVKSK